MSFGRRMVMTAGAFIVIGGGAVLAAPVASAFTATPAPGGGTVTVNQQEAQVLRDVNAAGAVEALLPTFRDQKTGETLGQGVRRYVDWAAQTPGAQVGATLRNWPAKPQFSLHVPR